MVWAHLPVLNYQPVILVIIPSMTIRLLAPDRVSP